jgi:hypothetical protein
VTAKASHSRDEEENPTRDERRVDAPASDARAKGAPLTERRASHRVEDDQKSGQGSLSALSKLKMLERKRAAILPGHDETK